MEGILVSRDLEKAFDKNGARPRVLVLLRHGLSQASWEQLKESGHAGDDTPYGYGRALLGCFAQGRYSRVVLTSRLMNAKS